MALAHCLRVGMKFPSLLFAGITREASTDCTQAMQDADIDPPLHWQRQENPDGAEEKADV